MGISKLYLYAKFHFCLYCCYVVDGYIFDDLRIGRKFEWKWERKSCATFCKVINVDSEFFLVINLIFSHKL